MVRLLGAFIVLVTSSLTGYIYGENLKIRVINLKEFQRAMYHLKNEITYSHSLLHSALITVSENTKEPITTTLNEISVLLSENSCDSVYDAFSKAFEKNKDALRFNKEDVSIFLNLSKTLGEMSLEGQEDMFELSIFNLKENIKTAQEHLKKNLKMYRYLGFTVGAMIVIILI